MRNRRPIVWGSLFLVVVLVFTGCAPRAGGGMETTEVDDPMQVVVDLPALVIDISESGEASVSNVPLAQLAGLAGLDLSDLAIPTAWVRFMMNSNIQHVQVNNASDGLMLMVNGRMIPSLAWDGESLSATAEILSTFGVTIPMLERLLPLIDQMGVGAIVRFPIAADQTAIPLYVEDDGAALAQKRQDFIAAVGDAPRINLPVFYNLDGGYTVGDLTSEEWTTLTNIPFYALNLQPHVIDALAAAGVSRLSISTDPEGIHVGVDDKMLPTLTWGESELANLLELTGGIAEQNGLLSVVAPGMSMSEVMATVDQLLPIVTSADFDLTVHLPTNDVVARR